MKFCYLLLIIFSITYFSIAEEAQCEGDSCKKHTKTTCDEDSDEPCFFDEEEEEEEDASVPVILRDVEKTENTYPIFEKLSRRQNIKVRHFHKVDMFVIVHFKQYYRCKIRLLIILLSK